MGRRRGSLARSRILFRCPLTLPNAVLKGRNGGKCIGINIDPVLLESRVMIFGASANRLRSFMRRRKFDR